MYEYDEVLHCSKYRPWKVLKLKWKTLKKCFNVCTNPDVLCRQLSGNCVGVTVW